MIKSDRLSFFALHKGFFFLALLFAYCKVYSQGGYPFGHLAITNYPADQYRLQNQNFDIVQDKQGVLYFGNNGGLLEYDGVNWRHIDVKSQYVYSLALSEDGTIWLGSNENFGRIVLNKEGKKIYESISDKSLKVHEIGQIRDIFTISNKVYFISKPDRIYLWDGNKITTIKSDEKIKKALSLNGSIYLLLEEKGFCILKNDEIVSLNNKELFKQGVPVAAISKADSVCFFTSRNGKYTITDLNNIKYKHYPSFLAGYNIMDVIEFNNRLIIGTDGNGVKITDLEGNLINVLNKKNGLISDKINKLFLDKQKNLWAATADGISKIDINTPVGYYDYFDGINGTIESIAEYENRLYIATNTGIYYMKKEKEPEQAQLFERVPEINSETWHLESTSIKGEPVLLAAENSGIYQINKNLKASKIVSCAPWTIFKIHNSKEDIFLIGNDPGVIKIWWEEGVLKQKEIEGVDVAIKKIIQDKDGNIWMGGLNNYLFRFNLEQDNYRVKQFPVDSICGTPGDAVYPELVNNEAVFGTSKGFYKYNTSNDCFYRDSLLNFNFANSDYYVFRFNQDKKGNVWAEAYDNKFIKNFFLGYAKFQDGKWKWNNKPFLKISKEIVQAIYHDSDGNTWLGGPKGLFRYNSSGIGEYENKFHVFLRDLNFGSNTTYFNDSVNSKELQFPFASKSFMFNFATDNFIDEKNNLYSYYLEGFDNNWSAPVQNASVSFTNLSEGNYTLKVRVTDIYQNISEPYSIEFSILPPWYRAWIAYVFYIFLSASLIYGIVRFNLRRLKEANIKLENIITERTKEIQEKNQSLEEQKSYIEVQKNNIEHKNKEITDSINYALRIQHAILPKKENIAEILPESFVLFKPKDIVSGDFYWMGVRDESSVNPSVYIAAADCTGHGVPGAFMSMIGSEKLTDAFQQSDSPGEILSMLNKGIKTSLHQSESQDSTRDGMDIALCKLLKKQNVLHVTYSGANRPIWIIKKGAGSVEEIKATKTAIGGFTPDNQQFQSHDIVLEKGDTFYILSDGYADLFSGNDKKLTTKKLKEILLNIQDKPMPDQETYLSEFAENWMNGAEQIDDILVIGIRA